MQRRALFHNQSAAYIIHLHHRGIADGSGDIDGRTVAYLPCFKETVIVFPVRKAGVLDFAEAGNRFPTEPRLFFRQKGIRPGTENIGFDRHGFPPVICSDS